MTFFNNVAVMQHQLRGTGDSQCQWLIPWRVWMTFCFIWLSEQWWSKNQKYTKRCDISIVFSSIKDTLYGSEHSSHIEIYHFTFQSLAVSFQQRPLNIRWTVDPCRFAVNNRLTYSLIFCGTPNYLRNNQIVMDLYIYTVYIYILYSTR